MDIAKAFADLFAALASAGPTAIVFALFTAHLVLDVIVLRAGFRKSHPLWVPGWIYEDKAARLERAEAAGLNSGQVNRDLTDALVRRERNESQVGRNDRRRESPDQWRARGQADNDRR